ncbi:MAG: UDP-N-acetylmuramoyl-tripeptide--D-alanyl-D-alanine ligase [Acidiferrobacteraceae bacterium]
MMRLLAVTEAVGGSLRGDDRMCSGVTIDSRSLRPGDLFVALQGHRCNGHDFLGQAEQSGASGAIVHEHRDSVLPTIQVADTRLALGRLAHYWRSQFNIPLIGVTGSNGKTTVKGMIFAILSRRAQGIATSGNLNNDIGVPLTLLRIRDHDRFAVVEMGMNHSGEITYLTGLAMPTVALVINAAAAHLEGVGTLDGVARAKGEIFAGLPPQGIAVINRDDPYCALWRGLAGTRRVLTFGFGDADVTGSADCRPDGCRLRIAARLPDGTRAEGEGTLALLGMHNVLNALAATAASLAAGATLDDALAGIAGIRPVSGRLEPLPGHSGSLVINDTYNANPGSLAAAIAVLESLPGERVLVLGDMLELGSATTEQHAEAGRLARRCGIDRLMAVGDQAALAVRSFGTGGTLFASVEDLAVALDGIMHPDMVVLVKGSRSMRMERVVEAVSHGSPGGMH